MLFDSHAHINYDSFSDAERIAVMERVEASSVSYVVDVGFNIESSRQAIKDAAEREWCYAAVGVHPHDAKDMTDEDSETLLELAKAPKVVAFGEMGLDFYRDYSPRDVQRDVFRKQLRLAFETGLPIIIHDRESAGETISILKEEKAFEKARVLLHCFSGSAEQAVEYAGLGATISVAGPVTYKNNKKTVRVAAEAPLGCLLIETDTPFLTPEPLRGQKNEPVNVEYVARKVAEIRGISYEEVAEATLLNAKRFYGIE